MGVRRLFLGEGKNILFSFIKFEKHTILAGQGGGVASAPSCPPLRTPMLVLYFIP